MPKSSLIAFISAAMLQAVQKKAGDRLLYIPCGVKDGVLFNHKGTTFGELDIPDVMWISEDELEKSRIADSSFKKYEKAMQEALSGDSDGDGVVDTADGKPSDNPDASDCDAEHVLDIKEALEDDDIEDARLILKDIKSKKVASDMLKLIEDAEGSGDDVDADLLAEFDEILADCDNAPEGDDLTDLNDIIKELTSEDNIENAKNRLDELTSVKEDEAIEDIKSAIADGDKKDATELLKFIKTPSLLRRYTRKVKGL